MAYGNEGVFGRSDVATVTAASYSAAGELIAKLKASGVIQKSKENIVFLKTKFISKLSRMSFDVEQ